MSFEQQIKRKLILELDDLFDKFSDYNFKQINNGEEVSDEEADEIETIFMAFRNVIAGTEVDGSLKLEYEKYQV